VVLVLSFEIELHFVTLHVLIHFDCFIAWEESGVRSQDSGLRTQESGIRSQDSGLGTQDSGIRKLGKLRKLRQQWIGLFFFFFFSFFSSFLFYFLKQKRSFLHLYYL